MLDSITTETGVVFRVDPNIGGRVSERCTVSYMRAGIPNSGDGSLRGVIGAGWKIITTILRYR